MSTENDTSNETVYKNLTELFYEIVSKNYKLFDVEKSKKLLNICGDSDTFIERIYEMAMDHLKKPHSEIRFNTFRVLDTFFTNDRMRYLMIENMKSILDLTTSINYDTPLPPPKKIADELNKFVLRTIKGWALEFGKHHKKLLLCYEFLLHKKHVDFEKLEIEDLATQRRKREEEEKKRKLAEKKLKSLSNEINEQRPEIENLITSLESCLVMLVPTPEQFSINDSIENCDENTNTIASTSTESAGGEMFENAVTYRETGMLMPNYSIDIKLETNRKKIEIVETEENNIIIENARDHYKLLSKKYLNSIKNWIKNITILSDNSKEISELIALKSRVEKIISKFELLKFEKNAATHEDVADSSDDSDMEEVVVPVRVADDELMACYKDDPLAIPSTSGARQTPASEKSDCDVNDRKKKLLEIAPKLPFDVDLYYWEEENLSTPMLLPKSNEGSNFWSATAVEDTEGIPDPAGVSGLRTRIIEFAGKFEPVKWSCRFPLPNGKLCPRRDRVKCPFHGPIVARDETGKCANKEDAKRDELVASKSAYSEAQNPSFLAEIKRETGLDLTIGKPKRRKKDESGLSSIREEENTVRRRLERKLFKRSTVKRVARGLDKQDEKRFQDKYGDQFQYIHGTVYDNYKK